MNTGTKEVINSYKGGQSRYSFTCKDGTLIAPKKHRFQENRDGHFWWLCDNFQHCQDGTDESEGSSSNYLTDNISNRIYIKLQ